MNAYPYIGKAESGLVVVFTSEESGTVLSSGSTSHKIGRYSDRWAEDSCFTNITREYLDGKCVKVISPEHMSFIGLLGVNSGFELLPPSGSDYIEFYSNGNFKACRNHGKVNKWITIPLPTKSESTLSSDEETELKSRAMVSELNSANEDEWQAGMKFQHKESKNQGEIIAIHKGVALVEYPCMMPISISMYDIEKPKTPEQKLADEIETTINNKLKEFNFTGDVGLGDIASMICSDLMVNYTIKDND
jgi:hypothetical protein